MLHYLHAATVVAQRSSHSFALLLQQVKERKRKRRERSRTKEKERRANFQESEREFGFGGERFYGHENATERERERRTTMMQKIHLHVSSLNLQSGGERMYIFGNLVDLAGGGPFLRNPFCGHRLEEWDRA